MDNEKTYEKLIKSILNSVQFIKEVDNDKEMADAYQDTYTTKEQRKRDQKVTELLEEYVEGYKHKNESNKWYKAILFGCSCGILLVFSMTFLILIWKVDFSQQSVSVNNLVELITVCVTFLTLIVGVLKIITKYVFPEKEEEYITRIVEIIQNNDLENKKENIRVQQNYLHEKKETSVIDSIEKL